MAPNTPVLPGSTGRSRPVVTLGDGMRVLKRRMQSSNNLQTELQTIADRVMRELEATKQDLKKANEKLATANEELETVSEELHKTDICLQTAKSDLEQTKEDLASSDEKLEFTETELDTAHGELSKANHEISGIKELFMSLLSVNESLRKEHRADKKAIMNLQSALKKEKARAENNSTAMAKLEQLKSQWSSINNILSDD